MNRSADGFGRHAPRLLEDGREELRYRLEAFRRLYSFLSQVIPFGDSKLEKLDAYLRFLETKLPVREGAGRLYLDDDVKLKFYRLQKISEGSIAAAGRGQKGGNAGASSSPVTFNLPCMPVRFFINLAYVISNFQPDAVGAEAPHHKACKAQPTEDPPGLRREEIRHPRSPGGLVARHDGRCRVAVEIEAHCDECLLAGGARGGKHHTRSGQIDA